MSENQKGKLKAKIDEFQHQGKVDISSADVADFKGNEDTLAPTEGDVKTAVPEELPKDPMLETGGEGENGAKLAAGITGDATILDSLYSSLGEEEVVITEGDREAFLTAMIKDDRLVLPFTAYGGRVKGTLRSRSQSESQAILSRLSWEMNEKDGMTNIEYSTRMRNMLLAAQVHTLLDEEYTELNEPYMRTIDGDNVIEPGWLAQADVWGDKTNEALVSAIYEQLRIFERKYWTMISSAKDQNFWDPEESTSE